MSMGGPPVSWVYFIFRSTIRFQLKVQLICVKNFKYPCRNMVLAQTGPRLGKTRPCPGDLVWDKLRIKRQIWPGPG